MKKNCLKIASLLFGAAALFMLSGCELPESWNDPAYFGDGNDLGKNVNGSGTGYETYDPDVL